MAMLRSYSKDVMVAVLDNKMSTPGTQIPRWWQYCKAIRLLWRFALALARTGQPALAVPGLYGQLKM
jgi:hypothetical protein